jgi:agmatine deiminase
LYISEAEARGVDTVPGTKPRQAGDRRPVFYVNFYIGEGIVVMPSFDDPRDRPAQEAVAALFPGRRVIAVPSREILLGGGGIHCITRQEPLGRRLPLGKGTPG